MGNIVALSTIMDDMTTTATLSTHPNFVAGTWTLDPAHSEITFTVKHLAI
jgi:polyisoprenoid-binding protein YceI